MHDAVPILHDRMHVLRSSMLRDLRAERPLLTALAYYHENSNDNDDDNADDDDIERRRILLHKHFKRLYPFLKTALARLLPYAYAKQKQVSTPHQLANLCNSRAWLLAIVFMPKREALTQITHHMHHPEYKVFRELADNILSGWCQFSLTLQKQLVDANKPALEQLADKHQKLSPTQIIELLDDAYPVVKVACDIITRHGYCIIFSGREEWKPDYASFT